MPLPLPDPPPEPEEERSEPDPELVLLLFAALVPAVTTAGLPEELVAPPLLSDPDPEPELKVERFEAELSAFLRFELPGGL